MPKSPYQHIAYFLHRLHRLKNYVQFSEANWEDKLASYNQSLANDELNVKSFGGRRDHWADLANEFPQYHRKASFLMIFAMLEDDLTQFCKAIAAEQKTEAFFNCWTRKEAYIKARGEGLSFPLDQFDVSFAPDARPALVGNRLDANEVSRWSFEELAPADGYAAALTVEGNSSRLLLWDFPGKADVAMHKKSKYSTAKRDD